MTAELHERLETSFRSGRALRVYCGYDVTAPDIHLGHTITIRKLRQFQDYGHQVFFVIGTFTTLIGDPSDHDKARPAADIGRIMENAASYAEQAYKILDKEKTTVCYNHQWLNGLSFADVIKMASNFTIQQFLARDRLHNRFVNNQPLWLSELLYPLAQGCDAVHLRADVQLGGSEQLFNLMAGRRLQELAGQKPQVCLAFPLLPGLDGRKMSKSLGNYIGVREEPESQYGKVMRLPDELIVVFARLVTRWTPEQVARLENAVNTGTLHPMLAKQQLAAEIVAALQGDEAATAAAAAFARVHQNRETPENLPVFKMSAPLAIVDLLVASGLAPSKSAARRLISQKAVKLDGEIVEQADYLVPASGAVLQKGPNNFISLAG